MWGVLPIFCNDLLFCNHFEELQTVLFEVELIISNAPLTYVFPDTIETCLTFNHSTICYLAVGRQLFYSPNTRWTAVKNLTVFSCTIDKINLISNHFWERWRNEYVVNLRETQRTSKLYVNFSKINVNNIAIAYDSGAQNLWIIATLTGVLPSRDSEIRGAIVDIAKTNTIFKRSINKLFTIKNTYYNTSQKDKTREQS